MRIRTRARLLSLALPLVVVACERMNYGLRETPPPPDAPPEKIALTGAVVLIGAGDIADCGNEGDERTAHLIDSVLKANATAKLETVVFAVGDIAYPSATERQLRRCFGPSWGDTTKGIMKVIRPAIGNHDYQVDRGAPYYRYFGSRAGPAGKGYYSYDLGDWHVIVLNSEIAVESPSTMERKEQEDWLKKDLDDHKKHCTLAYFHFPLFSSSFRQGIPAMLPIWTMLYDANVELVINGHDHHYERFLPQTPAGVADSVRGIEQIIVGTGGAQLRGLRSRFGLRTRSLASNSVLQIQGHFGVLKITLGKDEYRTAFMTTDGRVWDRGGRKCH
ncbi:MAG TPA: metallophosphoesterase [Gemmatimonadaceae bacterium]|jgi:hypothetical protein